MIPEIVEAYGVRLRPYRIEDVADATAGCADPLTSRFLSALPSPYTEADAERWITVDAPAAWAGGGAAYVIADPATDRLLGGVGMTPGRAFRAGAEIGYWVAPWARGRGVATAATRVLAARTTATGIARLELFTHPENIASQRVALAAGFRHEGVRRSMAPARDGERTDLIAWVRLADDPPGPTPRVLPDLPDGRLTDGVVTLRPLRADDADLMFRLHSRPEVVANQPPPVPPTRESVERRCALSGSAWLAGTIARMLILDAATGEPAGTCGLSVTEPAAFGEGMVGYALLPAWRGHGYATRAVRLLAGWAFGPVGMARLTAGTMPDNVASHRVLENVGFRREGLQLGRLPGLDGSRIDDLVFGLLPDLLR